jgi:hypothetical protein
LTRESRVRLAVLENGEVSTAGDTTETDRWERSNLLLHADQRVTCPSGCSGERRGLYGWGYNGNGQVREIKSLSYLLHADRRVTCPTSHAVNRP